MRISQALMQLWYWYPYPYQDFLFFVLHENTDYLLEIQDLSQPGGISTTRFQAFQGSDYFPDFRCRILNNLFTYPESYLSLLISHYFLYAPTDTSCLFHAHALLVLFYHRRFISLTLPSILIPIQLTLPKLYQEKKKKKNL